MGRGAITSQVIDAGLQEAESIRARMPEAAPPASEAPTPREWRVGDRARSRGGGWEGRVAALERGGRRATLEAGGLRIAVDVDDLVSPVAASMSADVRAPFPPGGASGVLQGVARAVPDSLDVRGATVAEALEALDRYIDDAVVVGIGRLTVIHGIGTGVLRDAIRSHVGDHPLVSEARPGRRGEGGDGATLLVL
jgi:DNA mismatch repair protein MutS2